MKWDPQRCPECGKEPEGTVDVVHGLALIAPDGEGGYQYAGETKIDWDTQRTVTDSDDPQDAPRELLSCGEHEWFAEVVEG